MKFDYKGRGFVVLSLATMLVVVGTINYQLSKKSLSETANEFKAYEQAQIQKNADDEVSENEESTDMEVVDSNTNTVEEKVTETSKEIQNQLTSEANLSKSTYVLDMKMNREKKRNDLTQDLNEMINNPSTSEEVRREASTMKLQLVKDQETELKIENLLSAKGFEDALVYISNESVNVVVNQEELGKSDAAKIFDLVAEQAGVRYDDIKLMNNNQ